MVDTELATQRLAQLEDVIERGLQTFVQVGQALAEIRNERLYKEAGYTTFEDYCQERWGLGRAHAYRHIEAARVAEALSPIGDIPTNESHARELSRLDSADEQREAWQAAISRAQERGTPVTAKLVREQVDRYIDPQGLSSPPQGGRRQFPRRLLADYVDSCVRETLDRLDVAARELCQEVDLSEAQLSRYRNGSDVPSKESRRKLARAFGCDERELIVRQAGDVMLNAGSRVAAEQYVREALELLWGEMNGE